MAITFLKQKAKQEYLILAFLIIILIVVGIVLPIIFVKNKAKPLVFQKAIKPPAIKIDFNLLDEPFIENSQLYEIINLNGFILPNATSTTSTTSTVGVEIGRSDPFLPYFKLPKKKK